MGRRQFAGRQALEIVALVAAGALGSLMVAVPARAADDFPASDTSLVYVDQTDEHFGQIVVRNAETGQRQWLTSGPADGQSPRWSPSGDLILYIDMSTELLTDLMMMESDGSHARQLLAGKDYDIEGAVWSPDSRRILLSMTSLRDEQAPSGLYLLSTNTGALAPVHVEIPNRRIRGIDWSHDGTIAVEGVDDRGPGGSALFVMRLDGSGLRQVTKPAAGLFDTTPRWSPDGRRLLFSRVDEGGTCWENLMVMTVSSGDLHRVPSGCSAYLASWWPDGTRVLYNDKVDSLFSMALDDPRQSLIERKASMASAHTLPHTGA